MYTFSVVLICCCVYELPGVACVPVLWNLSRAGGVGSGWTSPNPHGNARRLLMTITNWWLTYHKGDVSWCFPFKGFFAFYPCRRLCKVPLLLVINELWNIVQLRTLWLTRYCTHNSCKVSRKCNFTVTWNVSTITFLIITINSKYHDQLTPSILHLVLTPISLKALSDQPSRACETTRGELLKAWSCIPWVLGRSRFRFTYFSIINQFSGSQTNDLVLFYLIPEGELRIEWSTTRNCEIPKMIYYSSKVHLFVQFALTPT